MERSRHRPGLVLGCVVSACAGVMPAHAGDWTVKTDLSETISVNDNLDMDVDPQGWAFGSNSVLGLDILARSYVYDFNLRGSLGYQTYIGEGAQDASEGFRPNLSTSYVRRSEDTTFSANAAYVFTPASNTDGFEVDSNDSNADRQTVTAGTSVAYKVNPRNDVTISARGSRTDFLGDPGEGEDPNTSAGGTLMWLRHASKRTDFNLSTSADWYGYEDDVNRQSLVYTIKGGFSTQLSPRLSINASLGPQLHNEYEDETSGGRSKKTDLGGTGDIGFSYKMKTGSFSGSANYGLSPDSDGELQNAFGARLNYSYVINDHSQFSLGTQIRLSDDGNGGSLNDKTFSISPRYSYTLARDWQLSASYQFAATDNSDGLALQNSAYLTLSRSYVLLP